MNQKLDSSNEAARSAMHAETELRIRRASQVSQDT